MSRHSYHGLVRAVVDRPLVNLAIVLTCLVMLAITGFDKQASLGNHERFFQPLMFFAYGLAFSVTLPWLLRAIILGSAKNRYLGIFGFVSGFWVLFFGFDFFAKTQFHSLVFTSESLVLLAISLIAMSWGGIWSERLPLATLFTIPIQVLALLASIGLMTRMGIVFNDGATGPLIAPACVVILFAISSGTILSINIGRQYSHARSAGLAPRDAASEAVSMSVISLVYITSIGLLLLFLATFFSADLHLAESNHATLQLLGFCAIMFSALGVLLVLPGFMWIFDNNGTDQYKAVEYLFYPIGFDKFWKHTRRLLPNPSAYALVFIALVFCIVMTFSTTNQPGLAEILFVIVATILSGVLLLSLRAFLMAAGLLILPIIISLNGREFFSSNTILQIYNLVSYGLIAILVGEVVRVFRDVSAREKHPHETVMLFMRRITGPYILCCGLITSILVMAEVTNFIPNANEITIQFVIIAGAVFVLSPALAKILAARYGRF